MRVEVELKLQASEMAQEEIPKDIAFLDKQVRDIQFLNDGKSLAFDAPEHLAEQLGKQAIEIAYQKQRSLRGLARKIVYQSPRIATPEFHGTGMTEGIHAMGRGQIALEGNGLRLYRYFDRTLAALGDPFAPTPMLTPTLIPTTTLSKCDYFRSFPHIVTFTSHLPEDRLRIDDFRKRHDTRDDLDDRALSDLVTPEACLSPAVCYHVYAANRDRVIAAEGLRYAVVGRCFRYESSKMTDLRRLWEFTMREIVFLGSRDNVLGLREKGNVLVSNYLADHDIAGEIRTASDPFFIAPDADAKTFFQLSSDTKWEISLLLPNSERLAAGSLNYHSDFFGRAFACDVEGAGPMHSVCVAFGLERWVYAFLTQHGDDPSRWPDIIRRAPEMEGTGAARGASISIPPQPAWRGKTPGEGGPPSVDPSVSIEIERADAVTVSQQSVEVLREAWVPPALNYSDAYLDWQLRFPGAKSIAVTARASAEIGGFAAITPRRLRLRGEASLAYLLSFVAVRPAFRGRGVAGKLYDELLDALRGTGLPAVVYVDEHTPAAQRALLGSAERVGMRAKSLGQYANHGFVSSHESERTPLAVREATNLDEVLTLIDACKDDQVLWSAPDRLQLEHYAHDPRGRKILLVEEEGTPVGAAAVTLGEIMNTLGELDHITTVDALWVPESTPARIANLFRAASLSFPGQTSTPVVSAPNVACIPADVLRAARIRPTGAVYQAFALHGEDHPFLQAELTNLEVV
ncbi:Archaeal seryl-tRNA synthetase-related sequence [Chondromyces apiculatus DSM 436]|uniref:Archaeal seryl-tRNA synthetase-related sequence n=1 Tax=Chondromyces apiculatus DSM 436 TaxID=1192034 RepID=A0A017SW10_9BACT|nr:Archaeal seryl-tRNA synthetase-related sequence [Chondromyces apiculatus DSM 436]